MGGVIKAADDGQVWSEATCDGVFALERRYNRGCSVNAAC